MAVVTPNGQVLSHYPDPGLAKWKALPRADRLRLDDLGKIDRAREPAPPPGGLVLKAFARGLERDGAALKAYRHPRAHLSQEPGRDHLWLTAAEVKSLVPAEPRKGERYAMPAPLADRLCRRYLIDLVRIGGEGGPRRPENVLAQELWLTVEAVSAKEVRLRLTGSARFVTHGEEHGVVGRKGRVDEFELLGHLTYDRQAAAFTRFDAVALSPTGHFDQIGKKLAPLGVSFTLTPAEAPGDRVRPHSYYSNYFGKGK
jgi:hypothetical protein